MNIQGVIGIVFLCLIIIIPLIINAISETKSKKYNKEVKTDLEGCVAVIETNKSSLKCINESDITITHNYNEYVQDQAKLAEARRIAEFGKLRKKVSDYKDKCDNFLDAVRHSYSMLDNYEKNVIDLAKKEASKNSLICENLLKKYTDPYNHKDLEYYFNDGKFRFTGEKDLEKKKSLAFVLQVIFCWIGPFFYPFIIGAICDGFIGMFIAGAACQFLIPISYLIFFPFFNALINGFVFGDIDGPPNDSDGGIKESIKTGAQIAIGSIATSWILHKVDKSPWINKDTTI